MDALLLVLTDSFQAADLALQYATNFAKPLGARLVLLHVRHAASPADPPDNGLSNLNANAISLALSSVASSLAVPVVAEVGHGDEEEAVADAVRRHHPCLTLLGRPASTGAPDEFVRAMVLHLLRTLPHPILVVPHSITTPDLPRRVLLAVDGHALSLGEYAGVARRLLAALQAELTVLHVVPDTGPDEWPPLVLDSVLRTGLVLDLPPVHTRTIIHAHAAQGILEIARAGGFDMVVLMARKHCVAGSLFHRSVTAQVLADCCLPVLVLPAF